MNLDYQNRTDVQRPPRRLPPGVFTLIVLGLYAALLIVIFGETRAEQAVEALFWSLLLW